MSAVAKMPLADALQTLFSFIQYNSGIDVTFYTKRLI